MALIEMMKDGGQGIAEKAIEFNWDVSQLTYAFIVLLIFGMIIGGTILIVKLVELINEKKEYYKRKEVTPR